MSERESSDRGEFYWVPSMGWVGAQMYAEVQRIHEINREMDAAIRSDLLDLLDDQARRQEMTDE